MKRNLVALAVAALLTGMVAADALSAGHGGLGITTWAVDLASHSSVTRR